MGILQHVDFLYKLKNDQPGESGNRERAIPARKLGGIPRIRHYEKTYNRRNHGNYGDYLVFLMAIRRGILKNPRGGSARH